MRTIPVTNSGIAASEIPVIVIDLSVNLPERRPATTPPRIDTGTQITNATSASLNEFSSAGFEQVPGRHLLRQRRSEITAEEPSRPVHVLGEDGPVRSELLVECVDGLLRRERSEDGAADVAGKDRGDPEHDHAQEEERDERQAEALEEEAGHGRRRAAGRSVPAARPSRTLARRGRPSPAGCARSPRGRSSSPSRSSPSRT